MSAATPYRPPLRERVAWSIFILFITLLVSCKTTDQRSTSVTLKEQDHQQAADWLESINDLNEQGKYAEAIPLAEKLCAMVADESGPYHRGVGVCLNVLGGLYNSFGDYEKAERELNRALEIFDRLGEKDPSLPANSLGLLAQVQMNRGRYRRAEPFAERALKIREQSQGKDHFMVSTSLNTLGEIYLHLHRYDRAEPLFLRSVEIRQKHENAHSLVISLNNLCRLYYRTGDPESALRIGEAALELGELSLGGNHPHLAETLNLLGKIEAGGGRFQESFQHLKRAQDIDLNSIENMKGFTSDAQKLKFMQKINEDLHVFLSLIVTKMPDIPEAVTEGMNTILKRKGIILEVQKQFQTALFSADEQTSRIFDRLSGVRSKLTRLTFSGPGEKSLEAYRRQLQTLEAEKERLEIQLSTYSRPYTEYLQQSSADCETIGARLEGQGSALVELIRISPYRFDQKATSRWDADRYVAFILLPEDPPRVHLRDLGDADRIDALVFRLKKAITRPLPGREDRVARLAGRLYQTVFSPIEDTLQDRRRLYVSPDGNLNLIPFEIFFNPEAGFLIEQYTFNYVSSGRDILGFKKAQAAENKVLLMGDPDYDMETAPAPSEAGQSMESPLTLKAAAQRSALMRELYFARLPGTRDEVKTIRSLVGEGQTEMFIGKAATEKVLFTMKTPRILHLATHGFFLKDMAFDPFEEGSTQGNSPPAQAKPKAAASRHLKIENPLQQSGFVLAGANKALKWGNAERGEGVVTAEKILGLKLRGADMVVLSACSTGLGEVKSGEGVFGLRRTFAQAGAGSLVMSMWPVPDQETKELMIEFYKNLLSGKMDRCQALRQAALEQIRTTEQRYGYPNPFFWGAFVFMGEP